MATDTAAAATSADSGIAGDFWGGLAAMLVALPSSIAFGVTIFASMGSGYGAQGALAGILGATAVGLVAASFGGTRRLISAPCAPAAAVLSALAIGLVDQGVEPGGIVLMLTLVAVLAGALQVLFGLARLGRLIKYMPYPVVSGYLSGVGLIIILSQVPKFLGAPYGAHFWDAVRLPATWQWPGIVVGVVTVAVMLGAPRVTSAVPAAILALLAGIASYFALAMFDPAMLTLKGNSLVVGALGGSGAGSDAGFLDTLAGRWSAIGRMSLEDLKQLLVPAATLAVLLSIDTLKTCVVLDSLTRSRHDSNRELVGQGLGNITSAVVGGIPGAGTMGATLVNLSSGATTGRSGMIEGALALAAFLLLGSVIAWVPVPALAAILIVIGFRMFDRNSLHLLRSRSTILDFMVIVAVVAVAETVSLIAASGVGIGLALVLFIREQIASSTVRRKSHGGEMFSKQIRHHDERAVLEAHGEQTVIVELQGSLFFGTTDELFRALEPELKTRDYLILDMRRLQSMDVTAAHMLELVADMLTERGAYLLFSEVPRSVPSGQDMRQYFTQVGLVKPGRNALLFPELDDALEWVEDRILERERLAQHERGLFELREIDLFAKRKVETLAALEACMDKRSVKAGEKIFLRGDTGDELFLIRRGSVRVELPINGDHAHHLATFGRGNFLGEMSFLDHETRSADAVAALDTELFVLSRARFDVFAAEHRKLAADLMEGLARVLAMRLRYTNVELRALQEA